MIKGKKSDTIKKEKPNSEFCWKKYQRAIKREAKLPILPHFTFSLKQGMIIFSFPLATVLVNAVPMPEREKIPIKEAIKVALKIFEEIQEKNFNLKNFELAYIKTEKGTLKRLEGDKIKEL